MIRHAWNFAWGLLAVGAGMWATDDWSRKGWKWAVIALLCVLFMYIVGEPEGGAKE